VGNSSSTQDAKTHAGRIKWDLKWCCTNLFHLDTAIRFVDHGSVKMKSWPFLALVLAQDGKVIVLDNRLPVQSLRSLSPNFEADS